MNQILDKVRSVDPNDSDAVKEVLTPFFQSLSKNKDVNCNKWLRMLENVINRFPKYCGSNRATIEAYLAHFFNSYSYFNVVEAAKCAHALQQVRPPQDKSATPKSCWRDQMSHLCEAAHTLIDASYNKTSNIYKKKKSQKFNERSKESPLRSALQEIDIVTNTEDVSNKNNILCNRLRNVFIFIQAMFVEIYPVAKPIRPQLVLEVILKALSGSGNEDSTNVTTIKVQALKTLDAMILCLGSNLIPFSALVFRFVMQTLRWSSDNQSEESSQVRVTAYNSLTKWLNVLHAHRPMSASRAKPWDDELTSHILSDVTPKKHVIQLTANPQSMKNLSKKARKRLANTMLKESTIATHMPGEKNKIAINEDTNEEIALSALECAETFLTVCGLFLKPAIHKQFQELLVCECYSIQEYSVERSLWLLRALEASRKCGAKVPPPTQYCLQLYSVLINSTQSEISKFCSNALLDIRLQLHCSPPSLNFALEHNTKKTEDNKKRVSERNRTVLESLLGKERMPSEDLREEKVITIPDEPVNKKAKTDDVSDKISLSSDSVSSVEISDDTADIEVVEMTENEHEPIKEIDIEPIIDDNVPDTESRTVINECEINSFDCEPVIKTTDTDIVDGLAEELDINEAPTQLFVKENDIQTSSQPNEGDKSPTMQVAYDLPNTQIKVTVLDKLDDENLPSTNDTDDIQITCGQIVKDSLDDVNEKVNGDKTPEPIVENGVNNSEAEVDASLISKAATNDKGLTVEDMLKDFVDEVDERVLVEE